MDDLSIDRTLGGMGAKDAGWSLAAGDTLGGYRVVKPLGRGGMGEVYLVRHEQMGKLYALKLIAPGRARDDEFRKRSAIEARVMADLEHANIVRVHHMGDEGGRFFLTMDYVEGPGGGPQSLADLLAERNKLPETEARRIALDVARALEYSHCFGEGVVHRDLKPGNILIDAEGRARVTDFGLVRVMGDDFMRSVLEKSVSGGPLSEGPTDLRQKAARSQSDRALVGTYAYMAPEQKQGLTSPRSDICALGLVIYRMLTGERAEGLFALPSKLGCSVGWDSIMARTLAPKPEDRYRSAMELAGALEVLRVGRRGGGRKVALAAVAIGVLASVAVGGVFLYQDMARREKLRVGEAVEKAEDEKRREAEAEVERNAEEQRQADEAKREAEETRRRSLADVIEKRIVIEELRMKVGDAQVPDEADTLKTIDRDLRVAKEIEEKDSAAAFARYERAAKALGEVAEGRRLRAEAARKAEEERQAEEARLRAEADAERKAEEARGQAAYDTAMARARALVRQEKWKEATVSCEAALAEKGGDPEATRLLAQAKSKLGPAPTLSLDCGGGVGMELVLVPAGEFMMGSPESEAQRGSDETQHRVRITKPFYMGKHEVTQTQYERVVGTKPSHFKGSDLPVEQVSWEDATEFCRKLSQRTRRKVRLPTEAEWEYACRAGSITRFCFGDSENGLADYAWYTSNAGGVTNRFP